MKKLSKHLTFFLLITSIILPVLPALAAPKTSAPITYRVSSSATIVTGNWDWAIGDWYNILMSYYYLAHEQPMSGYADYWGGLQKVKEEEWWPQLATSWVTDFQPTDETNSKGFNNTGGRKSILFNLRDNVRFHDGSEWNATVMKWNIDRVYLITGNLTGNANGQNDQRNQGVVWDPVEQWVDYFTPSFNLSEYDAPDSVIVGGTPVTPPNASRYAYYYLSDPDGISPTIANNSNPYGGWDATAKNWIHYAPYDLYPMVRWVEIVTPGVPGVGGGSVRVHWNSWNSYGMEGGVWIPMISMQAYAADHTETGIYGYNNGDDMIGTGPYKFVEHDELADRGYMVKNEDYWNKTALEADGWYDVERFEVIQFAPGDLGKDARNAALLTHEIDYAYDSMTMPIDYAAVMADPNINYYEDYVSQYQSEITLNSINETWWSGGKNLFWPDIYNFTWVDIPSWYPDSEARSLDYWYNLETSGEGTAGIPIALREALTYAFDYDTMINVDLNGRAVRAGGIVGVANIFYNASIPLPQYNLTHAREAILNQNGIDTRSLTHYRWPINFTKLLEDRGLTDPTDSPANNLVWQNIANTNPIFTLNFYWDEPHRDMKDQFELAANQLGVALVQDADNKAPAGTTLWGHWLSTYWTKGVDAYPHSIWSAHAFARDFDVPMTIPEGWLAAYYRDPNKGSWRVTGGVSDFWPGYNLQFTYDAEIDFWVGTMYMSEPHRKKEMIGKMANKLQNELFPMIYAYQTKGGEALWANWDTFWIMDRDDRPAGFWGGISPQFLSYTPGAGEFPLIPGASIIVTLTVTAISMLGIIYILMRKKKLK